MVISTMSESVKKMIQCGHCLELGHNSRSPICTLKGKEPAPRPEKIPSTKHWTEEQKTTLVRLVTESGTIPPPWDKIAETLGHAESGCKKLYDELVPIEEQVLRNSACITEELITAVMSEMRWSCNVCESVYYHSSKEWRGARECEGCYAAHTKEIAEMWERIDNYLALTSSTSCLFCERSKHIISFNFDHVNMFDKGDSICAMVHRGDTYELIIDEIVKCQIICKSCHAVVTKLENVVGFQRIKLRTTRALNGTSESGETLSMEKVEEIHREARDLYSKTFAPIYPIIKAFVKPQVYGH